MNPVLPLSKPPPVDDHAKWFVDEVHPHVPALLGWLHARFPRLGDVEDIAQKALLRLWRRQNQPGAGVLRSPKAVLFAIARNAAIDETRHQAVARTEAVAEPGLLHVLDGRPGVAETVSARQELEFLAEALRQLPDRCRQVMTLTKIYGLTEKEAAARLGVSENTIRTHVVRGLEHCTKHLRRRGVERGKP